MVLLWQKNTETTFRSNFGREGELKVNLSERAFKKVSIISDFMSSHQPLDDPEELFVRLSDAQRELGQIETQFAEEMMKYKLELERERDELKQKLRQILDDFGSIAEYDNDDVIELHKNLLELLK